MTSTRIVDHEVSPLTIKIMIACYISPAPQDEIRDALGERVWSSPAGAEIRAWLQDNDLIDNMNRATTRGKAWVEFICQTPLPVQQWVLP